MEYFFFWDLEIWKTNPTFWKKNTFSKSQNSRSNCSPIFCHHIKNRNAHGIKLKIKIIWQKKICDFIYLTECYEVDSCFKLWRDLFYILNEMSSNFQNNFSYKQNFHMTHKEINWKISEQKMSGIFMTFIKHFFLYENYFNTHQ